MLGRLLAEHREAILARWRERIFSSYPKDGMGFFRDQRDPFANPVGAAIRQGTAAILDAGAAGSPPEVHEQALDGIVRIRAVQQHRPSAAVGFVFGLKPVVREVLLAPGAPEDAALGEALALFDRRIDALALSALDVYVACREKIHAIQVNEIRNRSLEVMERLNAWRSRRDAAAAGDGAELS